ncbi:hypothetical protein ACIRST_08240 [Kitasatospora sp. NPDC101447]|uniref:hypothetical protein n=1 Tax=Kitasatospora sp. NPDC101447 TaxID=3364102 RepID=UPI0037FE10DE
MNGRLLDPALGGTPHTGLRSAAAFARPRTDAPGFRQNDAAARALLRAPAALPAAAPAA